MVYSCHKDTVEIQSKDEEGREGYQKAKPISERNLKVGWFLKLIFICVMNLVAVFISLLHVRLIQCRE